MLLFSPFSQTLNATSVLPYRRLHVPRFGLRRFIGKFCKCTPNDDFVLLRYKIGTYSLRLCTNGSMISRATFETFTGLDTSIKNPFPPDKNDCIPASGHITEKWNIMRVIFFCALYGTL